MSFVPMVCDGCGHVETDVEHELDLDCRCGGYFKHPPYEFKEKPATKSSTGVLTSAPGKIACQLCGCRDRQRMHCECLCHGGTDE